MSLWALARTLGLDELSVMEIVNGKRGIHPVSHEGETSRMLVRVFEAVELLVAGDASERTTWMTTFNVDLRGVPSLLVLTPPGLDRVLGYLDPPPAHCTLAGTVNAR